MTITVVPRNYENLYGLLIKKEQQLRPKGAFYRAPGRLKGYTKWHHVKHGGWVWLRQAMSGVAVVEIESKNPDEVWKILSAFVGFLDRYFKDKISSVSINYSKS
jgi:hypothetical protein